MEVKGAQDYKQYVFWYEAIGTGMLLYAINLQNGEFFGQFGISFMLFALLLIGGPITGAHYNPAVTLGIFISNGEWAKQSVMFGVMMAGQFFGSLLGVLLVWLCLYNDQGQNGPTVTRGGIPTNEILLLLPNTPDISVGNAFLIEVICTYVFVMINLLVKDGKTSPTSDGFLSCLAVSFTLLAMICICGSKSGACLNPAVGFAQTIFEVTQYGNLIPNQTKWPGKSFTDYMWLYILAPFVGSILAGIIHKGHKYGMEKCASKAEEVKTFQ